MSSLSDRRSVLLLLCIAQLMVILDISAVNVALPDLARDLRIAHGDLEWTITSYSLLFGSLLLLGGRAADLLGRRRTFLIGLTVFTVASLAAALAADSAALYAARAAQGVGAALLSPAALSIITTTFASGSERARALGAWGAVAGAGGAVGVLLGGALTASVGWRAIFLVNVPIGVLLAVAVSRSVVADAARPRWRGLDLRGALLATVSLAGLLYAIATADDGGTPASTTIALALAAIGGLGAFAVLERRTPRPLLRIERLGDPAVAGGSLLMLLAAAMLMGSFLLTSLYLQEVLGSSALEAGIAFLPIALAAAAGAHLGSGLVGRVGVRAALVAAFSLAAAGTLMLSRVDGDGSYVVDVLPGMLIAGLGLGIAMVGVGIAVLTGARDDDAGMLSGLNTTGHEIGGSLGIAALTTVAASALDRAPTRAELASGLGDAFAAAAGIAGAGILLALVLLPAAHRFLPRLRDSPEGVSIH